jgi:hypothetical protein
MVNRVVVAFMDGRRARGFVYDISQGHDEFHLFPTEDLSEMSGELVKLPECKAIYFVKSLTGNPHYHENKTELPRQKRWGRPFEVTFHDGERIVGTVEIFHPDRRGFYLIPPDPRSNNLRIFVVKSNALQVRPLDQSTGEASDPFWSAPDPARYPVEKRVEVVLRLLQGTHVNDLSMEAFLPVAVLLFWKETFLKAARAALADEALERARGPGDPEAPPVKPDKVPPAKRIEIVLRLIAREDQAVVSQVFLVPFRTLMEWHDVFVDAGKMAIRAQTADEAGQDPDAVREKYEGLLSPFSAREREREELLDELSSVLDDLPGDEPPAAGRRRGGG